MHSTENIHEIDIYVSQQLKKRREALKISQHQMGKLVGVSYQQIQKYERGENRTSAGKLWIFAKQLQCNVDDFYTDYNKKYPSKPLIHTKQEIEIVELIRQLPNNLQNNIIDLCRSITKSTFCK